MTCEHNITRVIMGDMISNTSVLPQALVKEMDLFKLALDRVLQQLNLTDKILYKSKIIYIYAADVGLMASKHDRLAGNSHHN